MAGTAAQRQGPGPEGGGAARGGDAGRGGGAARGGDPGRRGAASGGVAGTSSGEALLRSELAPRELWARVALIVGLCAGCGLLASGLYDYTHASRPEGLAANLSLAAGAALVPTTLALLAPLRARSRDRRRLIELYGVPSGAGRAEVRLRGRRSGWLGMSVLALTLAFVFLAAGLGQALSSDPYEEPDPTVYGAMLAWAVILTAAGCAGIAKSRRYRARAGVVTGTYGAGAGTYGAGAGTYGAGAPDGAGRRGTSRTTTPPSPRAALYARLGGQPAAPHRLSPRLDARIQRLSRPAALALATSATLFGCALAGATMLVPRYVGGGRPLFWVLSLLTGVYLCALLLELIHYGPRRRYLLLVLFAGIALLPVAGVGYSTSVLLERGAWADVEVTGEKHHAKGGPTCELRSLSPRVVPADTSFSIGCDGAEVGDTFRVYADPRGEAGPRRSSPSSLASFFIGWGAASTVLLGCAVGAALHGHRRRTELGLTGPDLTTREGER
ncbi:hypothetical protein DTL70_07905 [Streptomyces diacarni]|uniref:Uncharacterized protein n=1 Tax=Streptomyces diacarni TaxID=2800381 RepID=A0A367F6L0_9ACTN|nr:hypothetical protein [Streptomyces diacarni]RCG25993.1 hypothetical protein DTL70_07905 [Streptomyces diacarni]